MSKKTSVIIMLGLIIIIAILLVILLFNLNKKTSISNKNIVTINTYEPTENLLVDLIVKTSVENVSISPNASIIFFKYYKLCNHTIQKKEIVSEEMVNLTQSEFKNLYSNWKVTKFTNSEIELYKEFDGHCGEHYLVKSLDGYVAIYYLNENNSTELKEQTDISVKYLALEDMNELENGVILYGKENLNSYIENFE